jgi:hypothetical protein
MNRSAYAFCQQAVCYQNPSGAAHCPSRKFHSTANYAARSGGGGRRAPEVEGTSANEQAGRRDTRSAQERTIRAYRVTDVG